MLTDLLLFLLFDTNARFLNGYFGKWLSMRTDYIGHRISDKLITVL